MSLTPEITIRIVAIGIGATALMDAWLLVLKAGGIPTLNFAFLGRWLGHMGQGRFVHAAIAQSAPVPCETALGWGLHYATGIAFSALLVLVAGPGWLHAPCIGTAIVFGLATVGLPLFVMQPAMGAGFASSRTRTPVLNTLKSLANHTVFGLGLYLATFLASLIVPT